MNIKLNRRALSERDLVLMGIPPRYWPGENGVCFSKVTDGRHKEAASNYMRRLPSVLTKGYGMMLWGLYGTGKTALAALICHEARRFDAVVYFIRAFELKEAVINRRRWDDNVSVDDRVRNVDLLVIDDLGKEYSPTASGWNESYFEDLIRYRTDRRKSTIITTNLSPSALKEIYKTSMIEVMKGSIWPIPVAGNDFRVVERDVMVKECTM